MFNVPGVVCLLAAKVYILRTVVFVWLQAPPRHIAGFVFLAAIAGELDYTEKVHNLFPTLNPTP